jgi:hypothetical protein
MNNKLVETEGPMPKPKRLIINGLSNVKIEIIGKV